MSANKEVKGLKKDLSQLHVWAIAFGCIIGWGSFINPGKKFLPNSGVAGTAIAMLLGAVVMIIIAYSYEYMVPKYPQAGGEFTFAKECFGKREAYLCGWFLLAAYLTNIPMNSTAIGLIVDGLDGNTNILQWGFHYQIAGFDVWAGEMILAIGILTVFGWLNIIGVKKAGFIQTVLAIMLVLCTVTLCIAAIFSYKSNMCNLEPIWGFDRNNVIIENGKITNLNDITHQGTRGVLSAVLATFAIAPWAYVGFDTIPQAAEEFKFSHKKVMAIMVVAILFGCFVYVSNNTVAALVLKNWPDRVVAGDWVLLIAAEELLGNFGKILLGVGVSCAVLSGIMGFFLASSRLMFSMARDGYLPSVFSKVDQQHGTPKNAIIFCMILSFSGPILGREALGWFVDMSSIGASMGYFFTAASTLYVVKRDNDGTRLLSIMSITGVVFSLIFMILQIIPIPGLNGVHFCRQSYIMLLIWIVLGLLFYLLQRKSIIEE